LVGVSVDLETAQAATQTPDDVAAARAFDGHRNRWFLDPLFRGTYPADVQEQLGVDGPPVREGDMERISAPIDFLGVNYYQRRVVAEGNGSGWQFVRQDEATHTDIGWEVSPDGLFKLLVRLRDEYAPPAILITENGAAFTDVRGHDAAVRDPERADYIAAHVAVLE
ncbi:family 1 glycosylhydrolase, partial [Actinomadura sp. DSM 109109]|nr:family 1 glycosylhydrolase [Actinomadura lepetitiana]